MSSVETLQRLQYKHHVCVIDIANASCQSKQMGNTSIYETLGRAVSARREELKLTQQTLAEQVGLSRASIANIEGGRQKVLLHQVYSLARALGLRSIVELVPPAAPADTDAEDGLGIALSRDDLSSDEMASVSQLLQAALPKTQSR